MQVSYRISHEELRKLQKLSEQRATAKYGPGWLSRGYWWGLLPLTIVGLGFVYDRFDIVVVCFVVFMVLGNGSNYIWKQIYEGRMEAERSDQEEWTVSIEGEGLNVTSGRSRHWYAWASFGAVEKTQNYILVHNLEGRFVVVPRHAFSNDEECDAFVASLKQHIPKPSA